MVNPGFILFPLYIYPFPNAWDPLFTAARANAALNFLAVINPDSGPGSGPCPDTSTVSALTTLHSYPNIKTLGYVHTASQYNCGTGHDICPGTQSLAALQKNISIYQNWPTSHCSSSSGADIHIDGIFFDEAPTVASASKISYMNTIANYTRTTLTHGGKTVLYNTGAKVDDNAYWTSADYINVFEGTEAQYDAADIGALDGQGVYSQQTTMIIHTYTDNIATEQRDVNTIMNINNDAIAGLFITDLTVAQNPYGTFPTNWTQFTQAMAMVVKGNTGQ